MNLSGKSDLYLALCNRIIITRCRKERSTFNSGKNTFGPIPESLQGQNIKFDFEMPITKIRKQVMAAAARQWALENFEMADMDPKARHLVNVEALSRFSHEAAGLPHEILNSPDEVERRVFRRTTGSSSGAGNGDGSKCRRDCQ